MKRTTLLLCWMALFLVLASQAGVGEPEMWGSGPGDGGSVEMDREVVWLDDPDPVGNVGSSEIISEYNLESEIANDFLIEIPATICRITWWGGYWNGDPIEEPAGPFYVTVYDDSTCVPSSTLSEFVIAGDANQTLFQDPNLFVYWIDVDMDLAPGHYWLSAQHEHPYPPQWGRLGAYQVRECDSMFRSAYFSYPDWVVESGGWYAYDASQMLESECSPTAVESATWGRVKQLYR